MRSSEHAHTSSILQIDDHAGISPLVASMKNEVQEQVKEGCGLGWESYKLESFVQKFSDTIFNFQERVDDVLSYTDKIDGLVCSMETCEYKAKTFRNVLEQIQKLIDDLNLRSYSNLSAWVKHLDQKVPYALVCQRSTLCACVCVYVHLCVPACPCVCVIWPRPPRWRSD